MSSRRAGARGPGRGRAEAVWALALALLVLAPTLPAGYILLRDMVFTPRQPFTPSAFGLGSTLPRAVPIDAVMAALTSGVPGMVVQKVALVGTLTAAGLGAARLIPAQSRIARCAAASLYLWNAYVAERLLLGHWTLLIAYAALPWLVGSLLRVRAGDRGAAPGVVLLLGLCALTPGGGLLAALMAAPLLLWPGSDVRRRTSWLLLGGLILVNAPWWLPGLLAPGRAASGAAGVDAFAARAELPLGTLGSLVGLGGVWNAQAVPTSRGLILAAVLAVVIPIVAVLGWRPLRAAWGRTAGALALYASVGLLLAWVGSLPLLAPGLRWAVIHVPGAGLLRDGQRLVAPLALLLALMVPLAVERLSDRVGEPVGRAALLLLPALLPLVVLPDLAWGAWGRLEPVAYPSDWQQVRAVLVESPPGTTSGDVVALPWQTFRQFAWNGDRTMLDPAPRYLDRTTVVDDSLVVGSQVVPGEDPRAAAVGSALRPGTPMTESLPSLGIGWVLIEKGTPGDVPPGLLVGASLVFEGRDLAMYRLGDGSGDGRGLGAGALGSGDWGVGPPGSWIVLAVDVGVVLVLTGCVGAVLRTRRRTAATVEYT